MAAVRGMDFKLYRNSATVATPTWVEVSNVRDLTRNLEKALADASTRGSTFRLQVGTLKDLSLEFQMVYDNAEAGFIAVEAAYFDDTAEDFAILDGSIDTVGSKGLRFSGQVTNFTINEALEDVGLVDVTIVPAFSTDNLPRQVEVATEDIITDVGA